ncbi:hypothetical protein ES703_121665 [subsurface metagenome]
MKIAEFIGLKKYYEKRFDVDLMQLSDKIESLRQQIYGHQGRCQKTGQISQGMFEKLQGSVNELIKISSEVLTLHGLGDASGIELMEEIRKKEKTLRLSEKPSIPRKAAKTPKSRKKHKKQAPKTPVSKRKVQKKGRGKGKGRK